MVRGEQGRVPAGIVCGDLAQIGEEPVVIGDAYVRKTARGIIKDLPGSHEQGGGGIVKDAGEAVEFLVLAWRKYRHGNRSCIETCVEGYDILKA